MNRDILNALSGVNFYSNPFVKPGYIYGIDFARTEQKMVDALERKTNVRTEGGITKTETKYALRMDKAAYNPDLDGSFVTNIYGDGTFRRGSSDLKDAVLFVTADDAARALIHRNGAVGPDDLVTGQKYSIVPVKVVTTTEKVEITTTEIPAKTVYKIQRLRDKRFVGQDHHSEVGFSYTDEPHLEFSTANHAAARLERRNAKFGAYVEFAIVPVTIPASKTESRKVAPRTTSRSLA